MPTVVNMQMQQRLEQMRQEILSRGSLIELIQRPSLDLYRKERQRYPMEDIVQDMRNKAIRIQTVEVGGGRAASAFTISFSYPDRFKAQAVVRELVTKFTESNVTVQHNQAKLTSDFLGDEMKQAKERMDSLEQALMKFKTENMGRLPEQFQANVAQLNTYQMMVSQANEGLSRLQQQKLQLETQLQNNNTNINYYNSILEDQVTVGGAAQVRNERLNQLNQRIMNLQSEIAALQEQLTPNHPTIKRAQASLLGLGETAPGSREGRPGKAGRRSGRRADRQTGSQSAGISGGAGSQRVQQRPQDRDAEPESCRWTKRSSRSRNSTA